MLDGNGKPMRIIFRPTIPLDDELDRLMEMGRASTKAGLLIELLWLGIEAKKEGKYGDDTKGKKNNIEPLKN